MPFILDASVACAWVFADEATPALDALLDLATTTEAFVPPLWRSEVLNTLVQANRRGRIGEKEILALWAALDRLPIRESPYMPPVGQIVELCRKYDLTAYDAAYLALALWLGLPLATLDADLAKAARSEGVEVLGGM